MVPIRPNPDRTSSRARGAFWASAAAGALLVGGPALRAQGPEAAPHATHSDPSTLLSTLMDPKAPPAARDAAAEELVLLANRPEVARTVLGLLDVPSEPKDVQPILLGAVASTWDVPGRLAHPLIDLAERADPTHAPAFMPALAALRTPEAARTLIRFLSSEQPTVRAAAAEALVRMTGRDDLGDDARAWNDWLDRARGVSVAQWNAVLAEGVWNRNQRLDADRRAMADRLTDGYRQLYLALPASPGDQRARLLSQMLLGNRPELRDLGFEIVSREVAAGKSIDGPVSDAAAQLLASPNPTVRARAAALVMQLTDPSVASKVAAALVAETDPAPAAQLLLGLARWPDASGREPALHWLERDPKVRPAAADALLALDREGLITSPPDQDRIAAALRQVQPADLTAAECRLLVAFGDDHDRQTVASLLSSQAPAQRAAAADALAEHPEFVDQILAAGRSDPNLFGAATRSIQANRATAEGYDQLAALPAPTPEERTRALLETSASLAPTDLLEVARATTDLTLRVQLLARLTEHGPEPMGAVHPGDPEAISQGIMLLAQTDLDMKRPDLAAAALDALPRSASGVDSQALVELRTVALLWSNRIEEAGQLDPPAPASAWIKGLEHAIGEAHARAILREIRQRFGPGLTKEQAQRVKDLAAQLSSAPVPPDSQATAAEEHR